jgi:hypothetical protein
MNNPLILVDAHVHLYGCSDVEQWLDSASEIFHKEAAKIVPGALFTAFLFLAETKKEDWFQLHNHQAQRDPSPDRRVGDWTFQRTEEDCSVFARLNEKEPQGLYIIAARQIKAESNLEVLALGTEEPFKEGRPVKELIQLIWDKGALPVIPWGAGKWLGARGQMIKQLILDPGGPLFFLGDSRNRPVFWPKSSIFKKATLKGLKSLPGSDPLPLRSHEKFPGSYGFWLRGNIQPDHPFTSIKKILLNPEIPVVPYGKRERPFRFIRDQFFLRAKAEK